MESQPLFRHAGQAPEGMGGGAPGLEREYDRSFFKYSGTGGFLPAAAGGRGRFKGAESLMIASVRACNLALTDPPRVMVFGRVRETGGLAGAGVDEDDGAPGSVA